MKVKFEGKWNLLFCPEKYCNYVNDHTIFQDQKGNFRVLGTCSTKYSFWKETYFTVGVSKNINEKMNEKIPLFFSDKKRIRIAPYVFHDKITKLYHLFFGPGTITHFLSNDGINWTKTTDAVKSFWPALRDPHVLKFGKGYYLYLTDFWNRISVYQSKNLTDWIKKSCALTIGAGIPKSPNSSCESPFVLQIKAGFLLFTTIVPWSVSSKNKELYNNTLLFFSKNPIDFGHYSKDSKNTANLIATIDVHAPEIILYNNQHYITTCGWKDYPKPTKVKGEGIWIRKIKIEN